MLSTTKAVNLPFNLVPAPYLAITPAIQSTHSPVSGGWKRAQHWNHVIKSSASGFDQCLLCSFAFFLSAIAITIAADDILTGLVRDVAASRCPPVCNVISVRKGQKIKNPKCADGRDGGDHAPCKLRGFQGGGGMEAGKGGNNVWSGTFLCPDLWVPCPLAPCMLH